MTKPKAKKTTKPAEKFILASGSHSRTEAGVRVKYEAGDLLSASPEELEKFPLKFLTMDEYNSLVASDTRQKARDRAMQKAMIPVNVQKLGARDSKSIERGKKLLKMKRGTQRRILIS